jgi:hypothetical protein
MVVIQTRIGPNNRPDAIPVGEIRFSLGGPGEIYSREYRPRGDEMQGRGPRMHLRGMGRARKLDATTLSYHFNELHFEFACD